MLNKSPRRQSGILVHPTSFPGPYGIGDLGDGAYAFIDFLSTAGQRIWQCLPLGPTGFGDSPYQAFSAFAGQPLLISPDGLVSLGLLSKEEFPSHPKWDAEHADYTAARTFKTELLNIAYTHFSTPAFPELHKEFSIFCKDEAEWLDTYALFMTLKDAHNGKCWTEWEACYKFPTADELDAFSKKNQKAIDYYRFVQFLFYRQWNKLKNYAHKKGIAIIGDLPIFVSGDSSDVWAHKELFLLDVDGNPAVSAGVPPDYFSATGQLWGNPLYNWKAHEKEGYHWWISRMKQQLRMTDRVRIDHFRGFESYWSIPAGETTAINGKWEKGPGAAFFKALQHAFDTPLPIIAEDLGIITPEVEALRDECGFPGMRILQFAFDTVEDNNYLPYNYEKNCVCYTGTHDNDTTRGWYRQASPESQDKVRRYMNCDGSNVHWDFIRLALSSPADLAIFPLQDVLGLDSEARMNTPGTPSGNWTWRYKADALNNGTADYLKELSTLFGRNQSHTELDTVIKED